MKRPRVRFISHRVDRAFAGGCSACAIRAFVTPLSVVCAWFRALFWAARDAKVPQHASLAALHRHMRLTEIRSGEYFMQRVLEVGFAGMLRHVRADVLVYPFENRSWEKHLLAQAQRHGVHRRVGYQHSSITPRHLAFHIADGDDASRYLPDCIVTIGAQTESLLKEWAPTLAGRITVGASLRTVRQNVPPPTSAAVLVAISSNRNEALSLLKDDARSRGAHSRVVHRAHASHHPGGRPLRTVRFETERAALDWTYSGGRPLARKRGGIQFFHGRSRRHALRAPARLRRDRGSAERRSDHR
jgi:hypothetical protein